MTQTSHGMKHPVTVDTLDGLNFTNGLIPVVAQDETTGAVLMLAWANREALETSLETGQMTYFSRSRQALWRKGESSGHVQHLVALAADCDKDSILAIVRQTGAACHELTATCWSAPQHPTVATVLGKLDAMAMGRQAKPQGRYTDELLADAKFAAAKIIEEANEVATVLRGEDNGDSIEHEAADLLYHVVIGLRAGGANLEAALAELAKRNKP